MRFSTTSFVAVLTASIVSATEQMQINYYSDACSSYLGQTDVTWATQLYGGPNNCYNFQYGAYASIANCYENRCLCNFFTETNCGGGTLGQANNGGNCVGVQNSQSFACYYS